MGAVRRGARRSKVLVIGNCQAEIVYRGLRHPWLGDRFSPIYHFVALDEGQREQGRRDLAEADLLLVQDIGNFDDYPLRADIRERAEIIQFPCLRFSSPWPFDGASGPTDKFAESRKEEQPLFAHFDGLLGRLRQEVPDREQRFAAYRALDMAYLFDYRRVHSFEERRMLGQDRKLGCTLGHFVLENFRTQRLFHTASRPSALVYTMLMRFIIERLGIAGEYPYTPDLEDFADAQVPVHPKVAEALGISWANAETRYAFAGRFIDWETYVRMYIDYFG